MPNQKKIFFIALAAAVIVLAVWIILSLPAGKNGQKEENIVTPQITQTLEGALPEGFPTDIPLNGKTAITQSYSATYPNSTAKQATISFTSSKSSKDNFAFYKKWASDNEWQIINQTDQDAIKSLYLKKDNSDINLVITPDSINISYVRF